MVTTPYEWKILKWDNKLQINKQKINYKYNKYNNLRVCFVNSGGVPLVVDFLFRVILSAKNKNK